MRAFLFALVCGRHENGVGKFRIFWDFWELWGWMEWFERERKIFGFLGNLSFLGFKRDVDVNLYYIKWKIFPKMYFLFCIKRKICSTEIFSTHQMGRYDPIWSNGCKRTAGRWPKCRETVLHGNDHPL